MGEKIATAAAAVVLGGIGCWIGGNCAVMFGISKLAGAALGALFFTGYPLAASENN